MRVFDFGEIEGIPFLVTEVLEGKVFRGKNLSIEERKSHLLTITEALSEVHSRGFLHRDLKPENVFLEDSGRLVLIDFGLARKPQGDTITKEGICFGTPVFMSPEQMLGETLYPSSE